ncbi:Sec-independent protein translocase subunit TatB [Enterobacteriaceae bacterium 4M9]|nr:Sec-independent protein translocase subunit TatB [Enterobacteriaceae bacterium 4M9]
MFDIGFSELVLVFIIGLIVLGPQRLPVAVKTVVGWIRALRSLATTVQNELSQELKLQELQDSLKKVEKASMDNLTPELKESMDELRQAAEAMKRSYTADDPEKASDEAHTIHNPLVKNAQDSHEGATPAAAAHQASAPEQSPTVDEPHVTPSVEPVAAADTATRPAPQRQDTVPSQPQNDKS